MTGKFCKTLNEIPLDKKKYNSFTVEVINSKTYLKIEIILTSLFISLKLYLQVKQYLEYQYLIKTITRLGQLIL